MTIPVRSSAKPWSIEEQERLRQLWVTLVEQMPERSEAAVRTRLIEKMAYVHYGNWPAKPITSLKYVSEMEKRSLFRYTRYRI